MPNVSHQGAAVAAVAVVAGVGGGGGPGGRGLGTVFCVIHEM